MTPPRLTVYTTAHCGDCAAVKRWLGAWGVSYREVDIGEDDAAREFVRRTTNGYLSVPTLVFADGTILVEPSPDDVRRALG